MSTGYSSSRYALFGPSNSSRCVATAWLLGSHVARYWEAHA